MKQNYIHRWILGALVGLVLLGTTVPLYAVGEQLDKGEPAPVAPPAAAVLITEIQTGATSAGDEFIELYNRTSEPVALDGWQVRYVNAAAADATAALIATVPDGVMLPPRTHYVFHAASLPLPAGVMGQQYEATLSSRDKVIALFRPDVATCKLRVHDALAWGVSTQGEGNAIVHADSITDKHLYRYVHLTDGYLDTDNNIYDAGIALATKSVATVGALNSQASPHTTPGVIGAPSPLSSITIKGCSLPPAPEPPAPVVPTPPPLPPTSPPAVVESAEEPDDDTRPVLPPRNVGLLAPQISELLPNPAKPQTDAADEFVELYNANNAAFELSGFVLEVGVTTKKRYTFPQGTLLAPKAFQAFMSKDTKLSLSNTAGQVRLLDPFGAVIDESDPYQTAKDGQAWLTVDNTWQWTTVPTPGTINVVKVPVSTKKTATTKTATSTSGAAAVKGAATGAPAAELPAKAAEEPAKEDGGFNPLHPGILALTGVLAVLYAIYEYRRDLANKLHQFRANRAARRSLRQKPKGR